MGGGVRDSSPTLSSLGSRRRQRQREKRDRGPSPPLTSSQEALDLGVRPRPFTMSSPNWRT
jgi:hypothetical protein